MGVESVGRGMARVRLFVLPAESPAYHMGMPQLIMQEQQDTPEQVLHALP